MGFVFYLKSETIRKECSHPSFPTPTPSQTTCNWTSVTRLSSCYKNEPFLLLAEPPSHTYHPLNSTSICNTIPYSLFKGFVSTKSSSSLALARSLFLSLPLPTSSGMLYRQVSLLPGLFLLVFFIRSSSTFQSQHAQGSPFHGPVRQPAQVLQLFTRQLVTNDPQTYHVQMSH